MALRRALLTLALLAGVAGLVRFAGRSAPARGCVGCHAPHYERDGTCVACHRGREDTNRPTLAHDELLAGASAAWGLPDGAVVRAGDELRARSGCRRCHVSGGEGNTYAISLDDVVWAREHEALRAAILRPVSTMPDFGFSRDQADTLIAVLLRDARGRVPEDRYLVRFRESGPGPPETFRRLCGACHRAITPVGPLGVGASGPDLTGLLTPHYPDPDGIRWDRARLARWLARPRELRPHTTMLPVPTTEAELDSLVVLLGPAATR